MFVPSSCCKDPENTPNISKCQGHRDTTIIPYTDPPVYIYQLNDQLYTEVRKLASVFETKKYFQRKRPVPTQASLRIQMEVQNKKMTSSLTG